jgi:hypothetical protein
MLTPNLVLELKTGYTRIDIDTTSLNAGNNVSSAIGLVNVNTPAAPQTTGLMPIDFLADGYASVGDAIYLPILDRNNTFQYMGSLTWTHGAHNIKAGAQFTRRQLNYFQSSMPLGFLLVGSVPIRLTPTPTRHRFVPILQGRCNRASAFSFNDYRCIPARRSSFSALSAGVPEVISRRHGLRGVFGESAMA